MKVLWISHLVPFPVAGGVQQRSYNLLRQLARYHDVVFVGLSQHAITPPDRLAEALDDLSGFCAVKHVRDVPCDRLRYSKQFIAAASLVLPTPYSVNWLWSPGFGRKIEEVSAHCQPDLVHFDTISLAPYRRHVRTRVTTLTHHNIESHMLLRRAAAESSRPRSLYFRQEGIRLARYEAAVAGQFTAHVVCSTLDRARLLETVGEATCLVVPNGVDIEYFRPPTIATPQVQESLIFAGRLSAYTNQSAIEFLLDEVWPKIIQRRPKAYLEIVGKGASQSIMERARRFVGVELTGFVDDVRPHLSRSNIYVCPVFDGGGTKLKMLDAMAMGKAIVAHPVACEGLALTHGREVYMAATGNEFADAIVRLFDDAALRVRLGDAALSHVRRHFSYDAIGRALATGYESLVTRELAPA